jgi:ornithine carbamoyltransferase
VYTDVWASMGQKEEVGYIKQKFHGFTICLFVLFLNEQNMYAPFDFWLLFIWYKRYL